MEVDIGVCPPHPSYPRPQGLGHASPQDRFLDLHLSSTPPQPNPSAYGPTLCLVCPSTSTAGRQPTSDRSRTNPIPPSHAPLPPLPPTAVPPGAGTLSPPSANAQRIKQEGPTPPVSQTVTHAVHDAWGQATATHIRAITTAVRRTPMRCYAVQEAVDRILALPHRVFDARGQGGLASLGRSEPLDQVPIAVEPTEGGPVLRNNPVHHKQGQCTCHQLQLGSIFRAARVL
jgi:hypothetical protein